MTKIYVLRAGNELMGTYSSLAKAQKAIDTYLLDLKDDFDAFDELVACADEPLRFSIDAISLDAKPIETAEDFSTQLQRTIGVVDYHEDSATYDVNYKTF